MGPYKVAVIGGDGIGPEVVAEALKAVSALGVKLDVVELSLGAAHWLRTGEVLSDDTLSVLSRQDAILLGAIGPPIGDRQVPPGLLERGLLLRMRFELDLYVNLRPFSIVGPGGRVERELVVVRENTEGPYAGEGGILRRGTAQEVATQGSVNTRFGVERCVRYAFSLAGSRARRRLDLVHKTNVLTFAGDLWQRTFEQVAEEHPEVETGYCHVDAACIHLVEHPERFEVIVTDNLFGDILTDLAGALMGGIGLAASGNLRPERDGPSLFEPVHGAAHDIVGTGRANPLAAIRSAAMMLEHLGEADAGRRLLGAVFEVAAEGTVGRTTAEIGDAVARRL